MGLTACAPEDWPIVRVGDELATTLPTRSPEEAESGVEAYPSNGPDAENPSPADGSADYPGPTPVMPGAYPNPVFGSDSSYGPPLVSFPTSPPLLLPTVTPPPLPTAMPVVLPTDPPTSTPDPFLVAGAPVRLEVPAIGVDSYVERVGLTPEQAMDVPEGWMNAGWYSHGFRPGEVGNAVIAGHLDTNTGGPAVFWDLNLLRPGDEITVTYENGDRFTFSVESSELYDEDAQGTIIERIFGPSLTPDLNLITCDGAWDRGKATYSKRLVVFAALVPGKTVRVGTSGAYD